MDENLDLVKILKDAPKGTELWSPICGDCYFKGIREGSCTPVACKAKCTEGNFRTVCFTKEGRRNFEFENGVCVLFPSKENRDWSTFNVPKPHKYFEPFQKVLRVDDNNLWGTDFYSHYDETICKHFLASGFIKNDDDILPYEGNEYLLGKLVK